MQKNFGRWIVGGVFLFMILGHAGKSVGMKNDQEFGWTESDLRILEELKMLREGFDGVIKNEEENLKKIVKMEELLINGGDKDGMDIRPVAEVGKKGEGIENKEEMGEE